MKQLGTALIAFILVAALVSAIGASRQAASASARQGAQIIAADSFYDTAIADTLTQIQTDVAGADKHKAIPTLPTVNGTSGETATMAVNGDTFKTGTNATAANLNTTISERRVAVTITVTPGTHEAPIIHRVLVAVVNSLTGYVASVISDTVLGASSTTTTVVSADTNGCAGTGAGCDPNGVQAADPSLTGSAIQCNGGYGSGTCPAGNQIPNSAYASSAWTNNQ